MADASAAFAQNSRVFFVPEPRSRAPYYAPEFFSRECALSPPPRVYFPPSQPPFGHRQPKNRGNPAQPSETPADSLKLPSENALAWIAGFSASPRIPGLAVPREFAYGGGFDLLFPRWAIPAVWSAITQTQAMIVEFPRFLDA